ncbi:MAG: hypothetical protein ACRERC_10835 [Candidatus Binatia bacterium]
MLHAVIRTSEEAFHFISEPNFYNLETLQLHMRGARKDASDVRLQISLDSPAPPQFTRRIRRWLGRLSRLGVAVELRRGS